MSSAQHSRFDTLKHALHHAYVALVLGCAILIADQHGWLNWLDSLSLRVATTWSQGVGSIAPAGSSAAKPDLPAVLLISDEMFEKDFGQASPLDRAKLAEFIESVVRQKPAALAIDLDLSPGPGAESAASQLKLDTVLAGAAKAGTRLVLGAPFPVHSNELLSLKARWMMRLCDAGVRFGFSFVQTTQGLVLRYPARTDSLGSMLANEDATVKVNPHKEEGLCELIGKGEKGAAFLSKDFPVDAFMGADKLARQRPLNPAYFQGNIPVLLVTDSDVKGANLQGRLVVLGSGFNPNDEFLTAFGPQKGAVIHAAVAFSESQPTQAVSHAKAILLDIVLGVAAGFLFHAVWGRYNSADNLAVSNGNWPLRRFLVARLWLFASFGILIAWIAMLMALSAWLLQHNLWNNPGPMILGVFVKTILASRPHDHHAPTPHKAPAFMRYADEILFLPVVVWGLMTFLSGH